jgi:hypothetical protein
LSGKNRSKATRIAVFAATKEAETWNAGALWRLS